MRALSNMEEEFAWLLSCCCVELSAIVSLFSDAVLFCSMLEEELFIEVVAEVVLMFVVFEVVVFTVVFAVVFAVVFTVA